MEHKFPLEQAVTNPAERFQLTFARSASSLINDSEALLPEASHKGLLMLGRNEASLKAAVNILVTAYGNNLEIGPQKIRYLDEGAIQQPMMMLIINVPLQYAGAVRQDLKSRRADIVETDVLFRTCGILAEAPLAELLGYDETLRYLTNDTGRQWMKLSRYAPLGPDPGGHAA